jgi:hypothetical protein
MLARCGVLKSVPLEDGKLIWKIGLPDFFPWLFNGVASSKPSFNLLKCVRIGCSFVDSRRGASSFGEEQGEGAWLDMVSLHELDRVVSLYSLKFKARKSYPEVGLTTIIGRILSSVAFMVELMRLRALPEVSYQVAEISQNKDS